jgi:hypothetical protein
LYDDGDFPHSDEAISACVNFVLAAMKNFKRSYIIWEEGDHRTFVASSFIVYSQLWNEPNVKAISLNASVYSVLANAVGAAL